MTAWPPSPHTCSQTGEGSSWRAPGLLSLEGRWGSDTHLPLPTAPARHRSQPSVWTSQASGPHGGKQSVQAPPCSQPVLTSHMNVPGSPAFPSVFRRQSSDVAVKDTLWEPRRLRPLEDGASDFPMLFYPV